MASIIKKANLKIGSIFNKLRPDIKKPETEILDSNVLGILEAFEKNKLIGWALQKNHEPLSMKILFKQEQYLLNPQWQERWDVAEVHGLEHLQSGFTARMPDRLAIRISREKPSPDDIIIEANNTPLELTENFKLSFAEIIKYLSLFNLQIKQVRSTASIIKRARLKIGSIFNKLRPDIKEPETEILDSDVLGILEAFEKNELTGWALQKNREPLSVKIFFKQEQYFLHPQWHERSDIAEVYGWEHLQSGFKARIPDRLAIQISREKPSPDDIIIEVNNTPLELTENFKLSFAYAQMEAEILRQYSQIQENTPEEILGRYSQIQENTPEEIYNDVVADKYQNAFVKNEQDAVVGFINNIENFVIRGAIKKTDQDEASNKDVIIQVGDDDQDWPIFFTKLTALDQIDKMVTYQFEIEIPAYIWRSIPGDKLLMSIFFPNFEEQVLTLPVSKEDCLEWFEAMSVHPDPDSNYQTFFALEHLRSLGSFNDLSGGARSFYANFAKYHKLEDFLFEDIGSNIELNLEAPISRHEKNVIWDAIKQFNSLLIEDENNVFEIAERVIVQNNLSGQQRLEFIESLIPFLAENHNTLKVFPNQDFKYLYVHDKSDDIGLLTNALAILVSDQQFNRALSVFQRLPENLERGWMHCGCILFAVRNIQNLNNQGLISQELTTKFDCAFLSLLDAHKGEWFSKIHDASLQKAMVELLSNLAKKSDESREEIIKSAVKHYGLSPDFWKLIDESGCYPESSIFITARDNWDLIHNCFLDAEQAHANLVQVNGAIRFFLNVGNVEADMFFREFIFFLISHKQLDFDGFEILLQDLRSNDDELVRFAASPLIDDEIAALAIRNNELAIFEALRLGQYNQIGKNLTAQNKASHALKNRYPIEHFFSTFNHQSAQYLNFDLMAHSIIYQPENIDFKLSQLEDVVNELIAAPELHPVLPAPVCSGLAALVTQKDNALIQIWLKKMQEVIAYKYGGLYDYLFEHFDCELTNAAWPEDSLVIVYSCRANLDSRISAIRETWLKDLQARNIPYLILVGDGDDCIHGDVLMLDVSDKYQDLPKKSLKLFNWVQKNTNAQYVLKIDDDCFLDVDRYFDNLSYRKHHYFGRILSREPGTLDRTWHHPKSSTQWAKFVIDKSPEYSTYCDGAGGYSLSRFAINLLNQNAQTVDGMRLINASMMEDKLVGDLLSLSGDIIPPSNEDYKSYQRRRTHKDAMPVGMWENIFFPSKLTPTVMTHLDNSEDQPFAKKNREKSELWPKKIWPSFFQATLTYYSNHLDLITDGKKLKALNDSELVVVSAMHNEMHILPHFLKHYRDLGVKTFIIADNCSDDGTREFLFKQPDVILYSASIQYKDSHYGVAWQQAILANHCVGKWALIADADEFLLYPEMPRQTLPDFVKQVEQTGAGCVQTDLIDMYPSGNLSSADFTKQEPFEIANWHDKEPLNLWVLGSGQFSRSPTYLSALRHRLDPDAQPNAFMSQKFALMKYYPWIRLSEGIHYITGAQVYEKRIQFSHFKYHAGFKAKVEKEILRKQHYNEAKEYVRYAKMLAEVNGQFSDKLISVQSELEG